MDTTIKQNIVQLDHPRLSISFFNEMVLKAMPDLDLGSQSVETFSAGGVNLLVAALDCSDPKATSIDTLTALAHTDEAMLLLAKHRVATIDFPSTDEEGLHFVTFFELPSNNPETHLQFCIYGQGIFAVLPSFDHWTGEDDLPWLLQRLVTTITAHRKSAVSADEKSDA